MKKLLKLFLLSSMVILTAAGCDKNEGNSSSSSNNSASENSGPQIDTTYAYDIPENPNVYIHYYNYAENYVDWLTWIWPHEPESTGGGRFYFQQLDTIANKTWATIMIDTRNPMDEAMTSWDDKTTTGTVAFGPAVTTLGIIIRNEGGAKEYEADRYLDLTQKSSDGATHLYVIEGSATMWYNVDEVDYNKISNAEFVNPSTIQVNAFQPFKSDSQFNVKLENTSLEVSDVKFSNKNKTATLTLKNPFDLVNLGKSCTVEVADFGRRDILFNNLYESEEFVSQYTTDEKLGAIYSTEKTTFKLWAPTASSVKLNLFNKGDTEAAYDTKTLTKQAKGVWSVEVLGDLDGKYYTYDVDVAGLSNKDIVDPYAQSTGINGKRGMVLNMDALNPAGWDSVTTPTVEASNDAIVYELHTRDLTMDETWNGNDENRGKFLGLIEEGTTYEENGVTYKTGFDHIKELGVTHVQLLPIYDFQSVDESKVNDEEYKSQTYGGAFNWGYDPQNYNAPEGSYSSDPYDGKARVRELKLVSQAYNNAGLGIIMDVVFNHMPSQQNSSFDKIVPGYYFRGRNDSGAGSDTASERVMFRKFMADVTETWVKEYKLSGYRFDLMGLHDVETMNTVSDRVNTALKTINADSEAILYGEGWSMYNGSKQMAMATQANVNLMNNVGAFDDSLRNAIRGEGDTITRGWLLGTLTSVGSISDGLVSNYSKTYAGNSIKYAEAHDNMTLWDKYQLSGEGRLTVQQLKLADMLAAGLVFTSQGTAFMHAGQEMLRTKEISVDDETDKKVLNERETRAFNRDSYNACDAINSLKWDDLAKNKEIVSAYKEMIKMRREQNIFHNSSMEGLDATLERGSDRKSLQMTLFNENANGWKEVKVIYNASSTDSLVYESPSSFKIGYQDGIYSANSESITSVTVPLLSFVVLYY